MIEKDLLIYDRKLEKGTTVHPYGLEVCKAMGLDKEFASLVDRFRVRDNWFKIKIC